MTEIELTESTLIIHLEGLAKTLASMYRVPLEIPLTHVVEIAVDPHVMEKWDQMEEKFEGPLPGEKPQLGVVSVEVFKKKMFWGARIYREGGHLQRVFLVAHDPHKAITIKLTNELYTMLVLKVTDPAATVARIEEAVRARKSSMLRTFGGWEGFVFSVAFSPDGQTLASGYLDKVWHDNTIMLWDIASGNKIRTLKGHKPAVNSVAFSPDGQTLASGSVDHTIKLWNLASGKELRTLTGHTDRILSVAFSPDGQTLASGSADKTIKIWGKT